MWEPPKRVENSTTPAIQAAVQFGGLGLPQLPARSNWSVLTNIMLVGGTNWIPDILPESHSNRFYRVKWLPDQ